ncbi:hypothetical protein PQC65_gp061 [Aeromonas phage pAEv1810]|uniref:hypothetical protein n=1 Tax=Aeromonas phage pAEv1810 TaxID=2908744 RepID=UPI002329953C|nr:hypothetical protein PQC65_gp061 [Aeromonas phage pAEv1810]UIS24999.1 hypothetical protein pAEv1810_61 [Aeromonas phage pAEv1810]WAX22286.1 hypothetical protein AVP1_0176 [Aeromonas phage AVP1]
MQILFNLSSIGNNLTVLSEAKESLAYSILQDACLDHGIPLPPSPYSRSLSHEHSYLFELVKGYVDEKLLTVPTPSYATLTNLGHLHFQLDIT